MDFINLTGIYAGLFTLFAIGIGFVWVIKIEYHIGACIQRIILFLGLILMVITYFTSTFFLSALIGIISGSIIWGASEMQDQEERAQEGHFPIKKGKLCYFIDIRRKEHIKKKKNGFK